MALSLRDRLKQGFQANVAAKAASTLDKLQDLEDDPLSKAKLIHDVENNLEQNKGAEQRGRTKEQNKGALEQNKGAEQRDFGALLWGTTKEHDERAPHGGRTKEQNKGAEQRSRIKEHPKGAEQRDSLTFIPILIQPQATARTPSQKRVWNYFEQHGTHVTNYDGIIAELGLPYNTLRKEITRLVSLGILSKTRWSQGSARGLQFTFHGLAGQDKGAEQRSRTKEQDKRAEQRSRTEGQNKGAEQRGISLKKIDRKDLSISLETLETAWPTLARAGFGLEQLAQIERILAEQGKSIDRVTRGLDHAEWELAHGAMTDKDGNFVVDPCAWVFRSLAQTGYYRRPKGYVSPEEQAAKDEEETAKAILAARKSAEDARFEVWKGGLTPEQLREAMQGYPGGPKENWLRIVWKKNNESQTAG